MKQQSCIMEFAKYTFLNVLGMIGLSCYILADTFFISKGLGTTGLAALNLAIPIYSFIHGSGLMLGIGGATKYSIFKVQKSSENSDVVFTNTIYLVAFLSAIFVLTGFFFSEELTMLLRADPEAFAMTRIYLQVILLFAPAFLFNDVFICFVRNDGNPRLSMTAMLSGSIANIILDYIFIFPLHMGILGAVLATGTAPVLSMLILSGHLLKKQNEFHWKNTKPSPAAMGAVVSLGFPSLIMEMSSGIVIIVFNWILMTLAGNVGVAAYGIIANLSLVVTSIYTGIAQGMQPIVSRAYGKGNFENMRQILRYGILTTLILSAMIYVTLFLLAAPIAGIFNSEGNPQLQTIAISGIKLYFTASPFVGFNIVISSFFTSTEKAVPSHLLSLMRGFILIIPMAFLLSHLAAATGVWLAFLITEGIVCLLGLITYIFFKRKGNCYV